MKKELEHIADTIESLGGESRPLVFENPAKEADLVLIEKKLNQRIPEDFRNTLLTLSAHCELCWFLPDEYILPENLSGIFSGNLHWGTKFIVDFNENKDSWIREVFPDPADEYDKIWHNKFVFQEVGNGDYLGIDLNKDDYGKIVYLSHDDGEGHGYKMANSFSELLKNWVKIGCVGAEDWQWLPFTKDKESGILADCENARQWRKLIGLNN